MIVRGIRAHIIQVLCKMGATTHPHEFAALLREEGGIISELDLLPGTLGGESHATMHLDMMPLDTHIAGSAHSHPNGVIRPSYADLTFFPRAGRYHIIIGYPYRTIDWQCFLTDGSVYPLEVVE
ncbi:MAG: Mov34/MPN/PAD-1 family protein [Methanomicrobiales archaeon]|nr:Mov34/MPN/PAD-1 family protein [Methanomicrobiales archaeon]